MRRWVAGMPAAVLLAAATPAYGATTLPVVAQKTPLTQQSCATASGGPVSGVPWAEEYLGARDLASTSTGNGVRIGLVDSGFSAPADPALASRVRSVGTVYVAPANTTPAADCTGHGTALASLMVRPAAPGTAGVHGLAPGASVLSVRATDDHGDVVPARLAAAIDRVVAYGAQVIAVPNGVTVDSPVLDSSVQRALNRGIPVIAAARFDAQDKAAAVYPAALPGVLAVGDVGPGGQPPQRAVQGAPVALAAPGGKVVADGPGGRGQVTGSGPSYAVAYVAAAAALVRAYRPTLTGAQVTQRLVDTATPPVSGSVPVLDPAAALHTEFGTGASRRAVAVPAPSRPQREAASGLPGALIVAGIAGAVLVLAGGVAVSVTAYRRRLSA